MKILKKYHRNSYVIFKSYSYVIFFILLLFDHKFIKSDLPHRDLRKQ